jgi:hypothetical protein
LKRVLRPHGSDLFGPLAHSNGRDTGGPRPLGAAHCCLATQSNGRDAGSVLARGWRARWCICSQWHGRSALGSDKLWQWQIRRDVMTTAGVRGGHHRAPSSEQRRGDEGAGHKAGLDRWLTKNEERSRPGSTATGRGGGVALVGARGLDRAISRRRRGRQGCCDLRRREE